MVPRRLLDIAAERIARTDFVGVGCLFWGPARVASRPSRFIVMVIISSMRDEPVTQFYRARRDEWRPEKNTMKTACQALSQVTSGGKDRLAVGSTKVWLMRACGPFRVQQRD